MSKRDSTVRYSSNVPGHAAPRSGAHREGDTSVIDDLMATAVLLPEQTPSASIPWSPEKRLAAAVLAAALTEVRSHNSRRAPRRRVDETLEWIHANDTAWPFSFLRLCALFDLDPGWVRATVARWVATPGLTGEAKRPTYRHAA